jgi:hypothetical protein
LCSPAGAGWCFGYGHDDNSTMSARDWRSNRRLASGSDRISP